MENKVKTYSLFSDFDIYLINNGKHHRLYDKFGAHFVIHEGEEGCYFAVYAPAAAEVNVIGDFNLWSGEAHRLNVRWDSSGIWEGFIPGIKKGMLYKYKIKSTIDGDFHIKTDPYGRLFETPPKTATVVWEDEYVWNDKEWLQKRAQTDVLKAPMTVYEVHYGSWIRHDEGNHPYHFREMADKLVDYVAQMHFTHVEFLPIMEHPYEPSWGYQVTGYFAPSSRYGTPEDFKYLVDQLHQAGIGVIVDWVPAHFPADEYALAKFDGSCVYEHPDMKKGFHPDWKSLIFNFERNEIRSFLISSALFWIQEFHIDGLRVDAVASMLYLDYSRKEGEWEPNEHGGNGYLAAISFLKDFNSAIYAECPGAFTIAEESTSYPLVSMPVYLGGLGFGKKWMMGWMHDTLNYFKKDPLFRRHHQNDITFSITYAFAENFMLALSHDEVVHGKASMIGKMPGDEWQRFANLRALYGYMYAHPGSKLLFMGNEIAQYREWDFNGGIDFHLLKYPAHKGMHDLVARLNYLHKTEPAFYLLKYDHQGFDWIDHTDHEKSILVFLRKSSVPEESILILCNFTPLSYEEYEIGAPTAGKWNVILNSDDTQYWGSGMVKEKYFKTHDKEKHGRPHCLTVKVPPLGVLMMKWSAESKKKTK
jgi:1,4-alpha-glucan branching enzyme